MKTLSSIYIEKLDNPKYYDHPPYNPTERYPEYPFKDHISKTKRPNLIYKSIRKILINAELDKNHYGSPEWNPLGEFISPGNTVLIKPNLVIDNFKDDPKRSKAIVAQGAIIRTVLDYCYIALKGQGRIIIGDAPLQSANLLNVLSISGIDNIIKFYKSVQNAISISFHDFRTEKMVYYKKRIKFINNTIKIRKIEKLKGDPLGYHVIDMGDLSAHKGIDKNYKNYRVTDYNPKLMKRVHNTINHKYLIPNSVLEADVVIHIPKFKSHRKAGITCCLKNNIGINGHKDWLPHHMKGSVQKGGDEYLYYDPIKSFLTFIEEIEDKLFLEYPKMAIARIFTIKLKTLLKMIDIKIRKDPYYEGSWWGNRTLWRTILDLNRILLYADKKGIIREKPQRKRLYFIDAIISGEAEGPLIPEPKPLGLLGFGDDPVILDLVFSTIVGFNYRRIPSIFFSLKNKKYSITEHPDLSINIISNYPELCHKTLSELKPLYRFKPTKGWKNHIEL